MQPSPEIQKRLEAEKFMRMKNLIRGIGIDTPDEYELASEAIKELQDEYRQVKLETAARNLSLLVRASTQQNPALIDLTHEASFAAAKAGHPEEFVFDPHQNEGTEE